MDRICIFGLFFLVSVVIQLIYHFISGFFLSFFLSRLTKLPAWIDVIVRIVDECFIPIPIPIVMGGREKSKQK